MAGLRLNRSGIAAQLRSPETARTLMTVADRVAGRARASAPVDSGDYRDNIEEPRLELHGDRVVARVYAESDHATFVEARTRNLGRALAAES